MVTAVAAGEIDLLLFVGGSLIDGDAEVVAAVRRLFVEGVIEPFSVAAAAFLLSEAGTLSAILKLSLRLEAGSLLLIPPFLVISDAVNVGTADIPPFAL